MKKVIILLIVLVSYIGTLFSQSVPPLPSIEKVFNDVKANQYVYKALKEDYHIADPKKCTFKMGILRSDGSFVDAYWSTYQSDYALSVNFRWPDDRARVYFTVITPKSTEGVTYELPLLVEYSRIQNDIITNEWNYHWWMFQSPTKTTGKVKQKELLDTLIGRMSAMKYSFIPEKNYDYPEQLEQWVSIASIVEAPQPDEIESDSYTEWMTRNYIVKGDYIKTESDFNNMLGYDEVSAHYTDAAFQLVVVFERDKNIGDQKASDWRFHEFKNYNCHFLNEGTLIQDTNFYATFQRVGFDMIYQKEKTKMERDYFTVASIEQFEKEVNQALSDVFLGKPDAENNLLKYCSDELIRDGWVEAIKEMKRKMVKFEEIDLYTQKVQRYAAGKNEYAEISIRLYYSRESWQKDKSLKKLYKNAGMSSAVLSNGGWLQKSSIGNMYKLIAIDNQLKISSCPPIENDIKF